MAFQGKAATSSRKFKKLNFNKCIKSMNGENQAKYGSNEKQNALPWQLWPRDRRTVYK